MSYKTNEDLDRFIKTIREYKVTFLEALPGSDKEKLIDQGMKILKDKYNEESYYFTCNPKQDVMDVFPIVAKINSNVKYVFIDEIDQTQDFIEISPAFLEHYDFHFILTGTRTFALSMADSYIYSNKTCVFKASKSIYDCYDSFIEKENKISFKEYVKKYIVDNIYYSQEGFEGVKMYPPTLSELYEYEELEQQIYNTMFLLHILKDEDRELFPYKKTSIKESSKKDLMIIVADACNLKGKINVRMKEY